MTTMKVAGRLLAADNGSRTLRYLLLPFTEPGRTNMGRLTASAAAVSVPEDVTTLAVNVEHDPTRPVGKFESVEATDSGLEATVRVLETRAGDDLLVEAREGVRTGISVELDGPGGPGTPPVIRGGRLLASVLAGAGVVAQPAFPSAQLVAADAGDLPEDEGTHSTGVVVIDGVEYVRKDTQTTPEETPEGNDAEQSAEEDTSMGNSLTAAAAAAAGVQQVHGAAPERKTAEDVYRLIASAYRTGGSDTQLRAALANITHDDGDNDGDGLGEITAAPEWLGEVWSQVPYVRKWTPLVANAPLTSYRQKGFHFGTKPLVQKYAGNKAEVPTGGMTATPVDYFTQRWAHAADLDRRYFDFGDSDVVRAFTEAQLESYRKETDIDVHDGLFTMATAFAPDTVPTGVDAGLAALIDGALTLIGNDLNPTFAIVGKSLYRNLLFTLEQKGLKFLTMALGMEEGSLDGFQVRPSGRAAAANKVLVGDGSTVVFKEFGGGAPVRIDAEHVSHGGKDLGLFGYTSLQDRTPASVHGVVVASLAA